MADSKISTMPAATSVADVDLVPIVQGGVNKRAAASLLRGAGTGVSAVSGTAPIDVATGTTTPVETITVADPSRYQIEFLADGAVAVRNDCNRAFGTYTATAEGSITIEVVGSTMAMCPPDSQDALFVQQLNNAAVYFFQDGGLFIDQAMDSGTMQFRNAADAPAPDASLLVGTTWQWIDLAQANVAEAVTPPESYTIVFNDDGTVNIQADCNTAFGEYTADAGSITITVGGVTRAMCPEESRSQQFLDLLGQVTTYDVTGEGWLELFTADEARLTFWPAPEAEPTLTGTTWQWVETLTTDETSGVADASRYTSSFNDEG
jgi:heat shock protein HslJ